MAKEEDVKKLELKVFVNCCDGCRKKVMKALSIKGVLRTDIHPSLPKVTVLGNVEPQTLIKKLAKCGKTAEMWPVEPKKQEIKEATKSSVDKEVVGVSMDKARDAGDSKKKSNNIHSEQEKIPKSEDKNKAKQSDNHCSGDGDKLAESKARKDSENSGNEVVKNINPNNCTSATPPTIVTTVPQVNYVVSPSVVQDSGSIAPPHVYHTVDTYPDPTTYYSANTCAAPPPPCYTQDHHYCNWPSVHHCPPPPPVPSLPPQFGDYFNDENTVGCNVM